jgi:glycosyltransferase involved in cell wall biosynthesis
MNRGGIETWLMHVLRNINRKRFRMDFLVHTLEKCSYDDEISRLGSDVIPCLHPHKPLLYAKNFKRIMKKHGPFDVVHSHVHHFSGYVLRLAHRAHVPVLIAHSHSDTLHKQIKSGFPRRIYLALMRRWIWCYGTRGLAASRKAAVALFGLAWQENPCFRVLFYGINLAPFVEMDRVAIRSGLGIPEGTFVLGHVGRFEEPKNHNFLVEIMVEVVKRDPKTRLMLIGDGPLKADIEKKISRAQLKDKVIFLGLRLDVPKLMLGAMDIFVLPSYYEGLPIVGLEAQAAGLPLVVSDNIAEELDIVEPLVRRVTLNKPASHWANVILRLKGFSPVSQREAIKIMVDSQFNIHNSTRILEHIYVSN